MNPTIHTTQSNTKAGAFRVLAGEDLTGAEGRLVLLTHDTGVGEVKLPTNADDRAEYVLLEGGEDGDYVTVAAVTRDRNWRVRLAGTCNPGDELTLAISTDAGAVQTLPADADTYYVFLRAEEEGADGQLVSCRPILNGRDVVVS